MLICNRKIIFDHFCYRYFSACMFQNTSFVFINTKSCSKIWLCLRNHKELATYAENPSSLDFNAYEANKAVVSLFRAANPEANIPEKMSVYIRLRAVIGGTLNQTLGETSPADGYMDNIHPSRQTRTCR